ncbi:hypothetical protein EON65_50835 [archaeon]|nr:MAG: hypothetical protein EON65_50835 [archaeon]
MMDCVKHNLSMDPTYRSLTLSEDKRERLVDKEKTFVVESIETARYQGAARKRMLALCTLSRLMWREVCWRTINGCEQPRNTVLIRTT